MKSPLECMPCLLSQAVRAARRFAPTEASQEALVQRVIRELATFDPAQTSPTIGAFIHQAAAEAAGIQDLYAAEKRHFNREAVEVLPMLRNLIRDASDPFIAAVKIAIVGNFIDFAAPGGETETPLPQLFAEVFKRPLTEIGENNVASRLRRRIESARAIVYLTDNAGEIAADTLLVEQLPRDRVTAIVRGGPIAGDALIEDARAVGLDRLVNVVESGIALPGTIPERSSEEARHLIETADLIISKGQGNFETLTFAPDKIFFLFAVKCTAVAGFLGCAVGDLVLCDGAPGPSAPIERP